MMAKFTRNIAFVLTALLSIQTAHATEGMWIPALLQSLNEADMQANGLKLSAEDIYSVNKSSLKDAIVLFGGGCTAEIISDKGLLLTNHHCGYGQIQSHSSLENDILKDGFWAKTLTEELINPNLSVTFIDRIEDVTAEMNKGISGGMSDAEVAKFRNSNREALISKLSKKYGLEVAVKSFFYGNAFYAIVSKKYTDVRLVGAPPSAVGKFGGDTDNWVWPRHTGDFSMFRIYANSDNEPATFNADNVPFKPKYHLPISMDGVQEGDFTMVFGFPGRTEQYLTSSAVNYVMNKKNPMAIAMREQSLSIINAAMQKSDADRIKYAAKQAGIANAWKKWIGQNLGLKQADALGKKLELEEQFGLLSKQRGNEEYMDILPQFRELYKEIEPYATSRALLIEYLFYGPEILDFSRSFQGLVETYKKDPNGEDLAEMIAKLKESTKGFFKDYNAQIDRDIFEALTPLYFQYHDPTLLPPEFAKEWKESEENATELANFVYGKKSLFSSEDKVMALLDNFGKKSVKKIEKDMAYVIGLDIISYWSGVLRKDYALRNDVIDALMERYVKGLMQMMPEKTYWPDANSTMRLTYGKAEGSAPHDGLIYKFYTTAEGILQKYDPENPDFEMPLDLVMKLRNKEYGRYATDGELRVCFTGSNHTTGGNSGSPAINGNGELIGLNFDRSWESTMSDILFDASRCRNIMVDIKYVLWMVEEYAGAKHLVDEMTLVQNKNPNKGLQLEENAVKETLESIKNVGKN